MISKVKTLVLSGLDGISVEAETDISRGMPNFYIVGLAGTSIKESKERVKSAIKNSGFDFPISRIVANLSPANIRKEGSHLDLPIALGILKSSGAVRGCTDSFAFAGELSLSGELIEIDGALPIAIELQKSGVQNLIIPYGNRKEAGVLKGINIFPMRTLREAVEFLNSRESGWGAEVKPYRSYPDFELCRRERAEKNEGEESERSGGYSESKIDFKDIRGQSAAKRAVEVAASGMHNILLSGPAGSGKTMIAKAVSSVLPELTFDEALEITKIHSIKGTNRNREFMTERPFRAPHHSATLAALCGGGKTALPGEISLAHNGILFLDEFPEFDIRAIESLRQPLEDRKITVSRLGVTAVYPSDFMLIATMNPCPCGNYGTELICSCTASSLSRYRRKLSAPILDRIDIRIDVGRVSFYDINEKSEEEASKVIKDRIRRTHIIQKKRFKGESGLFNSQMNQKQIEKYCKVDSEGMDFLKLVFDEYRLSVRAYNNILKLSRTIADMEESQDIGMVHIAEAVQYRNRMTGGNMSE